MKGAPLRMPYTEGVMNLGRALVGLGLLLLVAGGAVLLLGRAGIPLVRLPGDLAWRGKRVSVYFPLASSLLLSLVLSLIALIVSRLRR